MKTDLEGLDILPLGQSSFHYLTEATYTWRYYNKNVRLEQEAKYEFLVTSTISNLLVVESQCRGEL